MSVYVHPASTRERFRQLAADSFDESRLAEGAFLIAQEEYPSVMMEDYLARLDHFAAEAAAKGGSDADRLDRVCRLLFTREKLRGNRDEYYDPRNSYLNEVLDRRLGIPISLSIITVHVARAAGIEAYGVGLPGHYVVRAEIAGNTLWIDPFDAGQRLEPDRLDELVSSRAGTLEERHLRAWTARETLMRMLANLHNIHSRSGDEKRAAAARERIEILANGTVVN